MQEWHLPQASVWRSTAHRDVALPLSPLGVGVGTGLEYLPTDLPFFLLDMCFRFVFPSFNVCPFFFFFTRGGGKQSLAIQIFR